ncbi:hypothetical protein [Paracidovorax wautersii]|uniref:Uncharacterized protein n=1 Tax=Paracidovorax wautersii TaxID=1177982 RepID=A0ABU1IG73_9BURK|nr:hypothetical protein [Paracidovorax wautersii]MDR6216207.1 hypothetical protein [Paracidovorax wautersii]
MKYALFFATYEKTIGGWEDLRMADTMESIKAVRLFDADWAQIVDLEKGEMVLSKCRTHPDVRLDDEPWKDSFLGTQPPPEARMPEPWRTTLSWERYAKLWHLGGHHWLKAQIDAATVPVVPEASSADEYLQLLAKMPMPVRAALGEPQEFVWQLQEAGLIEAEIILGEVPETASAVVLAITPKGKAAIEAAAVRGIEGAMTGARARFNNPTGSTD